MQRYEPHFWVGLMDKSDSGRWVTYGDAEEAIVKAEAKGWRESMEYWTGCDAQKAAHREQEAVVKRLEKWRHSSTDNRSMDDVIKDRIIEARGEPVCTCDWWDGPIHHISCPRHKSLKKWQCAECKEWVVDINHHCHKPTAPTLLEKLDYDDLLPGEDGVSKINALVDAINELRKVK